MTHNLSEAPSVGDVTRVADGLDWGLLTPGPPNMGPSIVVAKRDGKVYLLTDTCALWTARWGCRRA